ncbi:uncharacterized protein FYW47_007717 [Aplochiton taeniatus]
MEIDSRLYGSAFLVAVGVLWNAFNLIATLVHLWNSEIQTVGLILSLISLANVFLQFTTFAIVAYASVHVACAPVLPLLFRIVVYLWLSSSSVSFWSIAWLSVLYCVKVVNFSSVLFSKLKANISTILNGFLVMTVLNSCVMFTPLFILRFKNNTLALPATDNVTCDYKNIMFPDWFNQDLYVLTFISYLAPLPLMFMLSTSLRLVVHLCKHTLSMRKNQNEFQSAASYLLLCKLTVALVGVYLTTLLTISLYYLTALYGKVQTPNWLFFGYSFYCIASAVLLTISNKYLRDKLWALFCSEKESTGSAKSVDEKSVETQSA